ncbi:RNA polymerase factor sigma-32 [Desulfomonile tiedjei]|uniref:RNA polymerase, sigma 32 subunit, RpoH n=1 Tax=Desulfomonile tiedjei (strain ATCC 49306 / DSM 6799 / DCB-1) TaxID=706587 RepID=I4CAP4_DESTA|nr:RNA polymerase factor sigma-32 [Desulfomonile tiedjei]AFM26635.1 RNA polymerase, sigma 32 subunit, RpoH [Desulfomonile tiedjei DSM 6799]
MSYPIAASGFDGFLSQVRTIQPLSAEREFELAVKFKETDDREAAHELVVSHLPVVVKVAFQYRFYQFPVQDLVQEGTIGLMKALKRFDPYKGYRLVSFAIWWIKAYIKNYILKSWNLVKLGTTQAQRKLFYRVGDIGEHASQESKDKRVKDLAEQLKVKEDDVIEMEARVRAREWSLNELMGEDKELEAIEFLQDPSPDQEEQIMQKETEQALPVVTEKAMEKLDPRERFIIEQRFLEESPWTLQKLGDHFGTTRERVRQLEQRALRKLRRELESSGAQALLPA